MSELSSRELAERKGRIVALIVSCIIIIISGLIVTLSFLHEKKDIETPSLTIISCDNRVYYGGDFCVEAAYKYKDGRIEIPTSNNAIKYECSENIVSVDSNGQLQVVKNIFESNVEYQEHPVVITISSTNKNVPSIQVPIKVVPVYTYSITKYYYDDHTAELKSESVPAWREQTVIEISDPILANYQFEGWYVDSIGDKKVSTEMMFHPEDKYLWDDNITIKPKFYAEVYFSVDDMPIDGEVPNPVKVYYDEPINEAFPIVNTSTEGWEFDGWFTEPGGEGIPNGVVEGKFMTNSIDPDTKHITLYVGWKGTAKLQLTEIIRDNDIAEIITREGSVGYLSDSAQTEVPVYYHGRVQLDNSQIPIYKDGGSFDGWYSSLYGEGVKITDKNGVGRYNTKSLNLYDKILFNVKIDYAEATSNFDASLDHISAVYGSALHYLDQGLLEPKKDTGWEFISWYVNVTDRGEDNLSNNNEGHKIYIDDTLRYRLLTNITIHAEWKGKITLKSDIDEWTDVIDVTYKENLDLPDNIYTLNSYSWKLAGWYTNKAGFGEQIESTSSYTGSGVITLYAKLVIDSVKLEYGNSAMHQVKYLENLVYGRSLQSVGQPLPTIAEVGEREGYDAGNGWYNSNSEIVTNNMTGYPKSMSTLYFKWSPKTYKVTFNSNGGTSIATQTVEVKMGETIPSFIAPTREGNDFSGYYTQQIGGIKYFSPGLDGTIVTAVADGPWTIAADTVLYAHWGETSYKVTLEQNGGTGGTTNVYPTYGQTMPAAVAPTRTGFTFIGYFDDDNNEYYNDSMMGSKWDKPNDATLQAKWEANPLYITVKNGGSIVNEGTTISSIKGEIKISISASNGTGDYSYSFKDNNNHLNVSDGNTSLVKISRKNGDKKGSVTITVTDNVSLATKQFTFNYTTSGGCFVAGTLITMADGSLRPIEEVKVGDLVLSWNFMTGKYENAPVSQFYHLQDENADVLTMKFDDGSKIEVVYSHGFFDVDLNEFVFITNENYNNYIGHSFIKCNGQNIESAKLISVSCTTKTLEFFAILTACNYNAVAEGFLTLTKPYVDGIFTCFEIGDNLMYDQEKMQADINKYGLYTYEEALGILQDMGFEYFPYEYYVAVNVQYYKILIGKGIVTFDDIKFFVSDMMKNG